MTEDLGGISVHIDIEDEDVQSGLDVIEKRLLNLQGQTHTVTLRIDEAESGGTGGATKGRPRKTTIMAALALEKNAEANLQKQVNEFKLTAPIELSLAQGTIEALQKQIQEAFANFRVNIKVNYESDGQPEETVPGTHGTVARTTGAAPRPARPARTGPTRIIQPPQPEREDPGLLRRQATALRKAIEDAARDPASSPKVMAQFAARAETMERKSIAIEKGEVQETAPRTLYGRKRGARPKRVIARRPSYGQAVQVYPSSVGEEPSSGTLSSYEMHRRTALAGYSSGRLPERGMEGPREGTLTAGTGESELETEGALAREEQRRFAEARRLALGPIASGEQKFAPGERQYRSRRRGPTRRMPLGANPIVRGGGVFEAEHTRVRERQEAEGTIKRLTEHGPRPEPLPDLSREGGVPTRDVEDSGERGRFNPLGRYASDPRLRDIQIAFERGDYGTPDEPILGELTTEGKQSGKRRKFNAADQRALDKDNLTRTAGRIVNRKGRIKAEILSPRIVALEEANKSLGKEGFSSLSGKDANRFLATIGGLKEDDRRLAEEQGLTRATPGAGVAVGPGGYVGVGTVGGEPAGPAAETPAQSRMRLERTRAKEVLEGLDPETRATAIAIRDSKKPGAQREFNAFIKPFRPELRVGGVSAPEERRKRRDLPVDFGYGSGQKQTRPDDPSSQVDISDTELSKFFEMSRAGNIDLSDVEERHRRTGPVTSESAYRSRVSQFGAQRLAQGLPGRTKGGARGLNPAQEDTYWSHIAILKADRAAVEAAAKGVSGTERAAQTSPNRRDFGPVETAYQNAQDRIRAIEGTGGYTYELGETGEPERVYKEGLPTYAQETGTTEESRRQIRGGRGTKRTDPGTLGLLHSRPSKENPGGPRVEGVPDPAERQLLMEELRTLKEQLPDLQAAAGVERSADQARGVAFGQARTTDPKVLPGETFRDKVAARAGVQIPASEAPFEPQVGPLLQVPKEFFKGPNGFRKRPEAQQLYLESGQPLNIRDTNVRPVTSTATPAAPAAPTPIAELRARVEADANARYTERLGGEQLGMFEEEQPAIRLRAAGEQVSGILPPGEGLTASGGIVPVSVRDSVALDVKIIGGAAAATKAPGAATAKASSEQEPRPEAAGTTGTPGETKEQIAARKLRASTTANLDRQLREQFPDFELERPEHLASTGKSEARIEAESKILEARALNPTRAFQTAVAAGFAKTIGGGGDFEKRVKTLTKALGEQAVSIEGVSQTRSDLGVRRRNLQGLIGLQEKEVTGLRASGVSEADIPKRLNPALERRINVAREERAEAGAEAVAARRRRAEANRGVEGASGRNLISPLGVAQGFAALGGGAIVGGLIFSAASKAVEAGVSVIAAGLEKAADALSGFANTANRVNAELSAALRGAAGSSGAIAGAAAPTGINLALFNQISGPLEQRAQAQAAAQNQSALGDLLKTANFNNRGGFDRALFEGTGGFLGGSLGAPQQGFTEQLANNLEAAAGQQRYKALSGEGQTGGGVYGQRMGRIIQAGTDTGAAAAFIADLGKNLEKVNSEFVVLAADSAPELVESFKKSAEAVGDLENANKLLANGLVIGRRGGGGLEGTEYGSAAADLARGQNLVDPQVAFQQGQRQMEAQVRDLRRRRDYALDVSMPRQQGLQSLLQPQRAPGTGIDAANAEEAAKVQASTAQTVRLQTDLNSQYAKGQELLRDIIPKDLFDRIKNTGEEILRIQTNLANAQAKLQTAEYTNQLRIAKRTLADLVGLTGKVGAGEASQLGVLEKQNLLLSRRAALIQLELQQRSLNFQRAVAGFSTPGQTPEEIAARRRDTETQVSFAQELLNIGKQTNANQIKIVDEQNLRALQDAVASIRLLEQARQVTFDAALAQEQIDALGKQLDADAQRAGAYITEVEGAAAIAFSKIADLEAAYGKAIGNVTLQVINGFTRTINGLVVQLGKAFGSKSSQDNSPDDRDRYASGALFNTSGTTSMIVGEAGTETVAVLRNPRTASISGVGGGGGVTININNPVVKDEADIAKIARAVEDVLNRRAALLGLR